MNKVADIVKSYRNRAIRSEEMIELLAIRYECTPSDIEETLTLRGEPIVHDPPRTCGARKKWTVSELAQVYSLHRCGYRHQEIADAMAVSLNSIRYVIHRYRRELFTEEAYL